MRDHGSDGTQIRREIRIEASPETVFGFLIDPARIPIWMGRSAVFEPRPGGDFKIEINDRDTASGKVVEVTPYERVVFTFGWEATDNPIVPGSTTVELSLRRDGDGTVVTLVHTGLPEAAIADHITGWDHYLARLATAAAGGDPGPDPNDRPANM